MLKTSQTRAVAQRTGQTLMRRSETRVTVASLIAERVDLERAAKPRSPFDGAKTAGQSGNEADHAPVDPQRRAGCRRRLLGAHIDDHIGDLIRRRETPDETRRTASSTRAFPRPLTMIVAPARARLSAVARPIPAVDPVTIALRPLRLIFMSVSSLLLPPPLHGQGAQPIPGDTGRGPLDEYARSPRGRTSPAASPRSARGSHHSWE